MNKKIKELKESNKKLEKILKEHVSATVRITEADRKLFSNSLDLIDASEKVGRDANYLAWKIRDVKHEAFVVGMHYTRLIELNKKDIEILKLQKRIKKLEEKKKEYE